MSSQSQNLALPLTAGPEVASVSLSGSLPAERLTLTVADDYSIPAGGVISLPQDKSARYGHFPQPDGQAGCCTDGNAGAYTR